MRFHDLIRGAAVLGIAAVMTFSPSLASANHPNDRPERAVVLSGTVSGNVDAVPPTLKVGKQAYLRFEYPGDNSKVMIQVDITPGDPGAAGNAGFHVYGPTNGKLYATGGQTGKRPSHEVELASAEAGTYLVEIFNANVNPIHYAASAIGLPPQVVPTMAPAVEAVEFVVAPTPPPVPIGQNTSAELATVLDASLAATLAGNPSGSFHYYRFDYAGDGSPVQIDLDVTPSDAQTAQTAGFVIYGPTAGREYTRGGYQGKSPTHSTTLITNEAGTYLVQLFNYGPAPIQYHLSASGLPVPRTPVTTIASRAEPAPAAADPATVGSNVSRQRSVELTEPVTAVLTGGAAASSHFYSFNYPGDGSTFRVDVDATPSDPETGRTTGFVLYGPNGQEITRGVYQGTRRPTHTGSHASNEPGIYLVQVYNSSPSAIAYRVSLARS
jgi:hypothetical protein